MIIVLCIAFIMYFQPKVANKDHLSIDLLRANDHNFDKLCPQDKLKTVFGNQDETVMRLLAKTQDKCLEKRKTFFLNI